MKRVKFNNVEFQRCQLGWRCEINFWVETKRQFTDEMHTMNGYGKKGWNGLFGMVTAFFNAREEVKQRCKYLKDKPGPFEIGT